MRQAVCAAEGRAKEKELPKSSGTHKSLNQMPDSELQDFTATLLDFGFPYV